MIFKPGDEEFELTRARIDFIRKHAWPGFGFGFIDSVDNQVETRQFVSDKQMNAIQKSFEAVEKHFAKTIEEEKARAIVSLGLQSNRCTECGTEFQGEGAVCGDCQVRP